MHKIDAHTPTKGCTVSERERQVAKKKVLGNIDQLAQGSQQLQTQCSCLEHYVEPNVTNACLNSCSAKFEVWFKAGTLLLWIISFIMVNLLMLSLEILSVFSSFKVHHE